MIERIIAQLNNALYGYILIILLVLAGLYFTIRTGFAPFRLFREQLRAVTEKPANSLFSMQKILTCHMMWITGIKYENHRDSKISRFYFT